MTKIERPWRRIGLDVIIKRASSIHNNKYDYSMAKKDYETTHTKVSIICPKHGTFIQAMHQHTGKNAQGCPKCGTRINEQYERKYKINDGFFATDNEFSFYVAGFIAADGCLKTRDKSLGENAGYQIAIGLARKDRRFLANLRNTMGIGNPICDYHYPLKDEDREAGRKKDICGSSLSFNSRQMYEDLQNRFGIGPRKSLTYVMPKRLVDHPLVRHFIRGFTDGDGSFHITYTGGSRDGTIGGRTRTLGYSLCGTPELLRDVQNIFTEACNRPMNTIKISKDKRGSHYLRYTGNIIAGQVGKYLYQDAKIYMARKRKFIVKYLTKPTPSE